MNFITRTNLFILAGLLNVATAVKVAVEGAPDHRVVLFAVLAVVAFLMADAAAADARADRARATAARRRSAEVITRFRTVEAEDFEVNRQVGAYVLRKR